MEVFGIDISVWQRDMNIATAKKEGVKFAVVRGMYGNAKDTHFESNYQKVIAQGLGVGAYQWGRAKNKAQAKEEAELFISHCLKGKTFDYPIYYDVEDSIMIGLSKQALTEVIETWCQTMEKAGYFCGIYMSDHAMKTETEKAKLIAKYSAWIAYWTTKAKKPVCQMWQFGGETNLVRTNKVAGMTCDQDYAYVDFPSIIKSNGLNGYPKPTKPVATVNSCKNLEVKHDGKLWRTWDTVSKQYVKYTGVAGNAAGWWYCKDGVVDFKFNGWANNDNGRWYCKDGKVDFTKTRNDLANMIKGFSMNQIKEILKQ